MPAWPSFAFVTIWLLYSVNLNPIVAVRTYNEVRLAQLRDEVKSMFYYAYDNYVSNAYPYDELRPLTCDGVDTWGSYSLTLIDTLDTLAVIGNYSEFRRVAQLIIENAQFDMNINVSVFETNIRIIGGLLSAHLLSHKAGMELETGWPCNGPLLRLAEKVARKLLPAFDTKTGMPYGTVNLRFGVPPQETPITCTAGVGTFIVEFGALSRLTGDPLYEKVAMRAIHALYARRSKLDLFGNHIDTESGKWTAIDSGIGAGVDSFFEYLVKGSFLLQKPELMQMFRVSFNAIEKHLSKGGWYVWATMAQGHVSATTFQSLESFWPGLLSLIGEFKIGLKAITNYHRIWKQYGGLPELYNILQGKASHNREGYPLRPELIESAMYLYQATGNPFMLEIGEDMLKSIQRNTKTHCGFATIRDVTTLTLEDRMESFFLSETVKYLYLLFDPNNFLHNEGDDFETIFNPTRGTCTLYAGGYIYNTEAHPIDPSALHCCSGPTHAELHEEIAVIDEFRTSTRFEGKKTIKQKNREAKKKKKDQEKVSEISKQESTPAKIPPTNDSDNTQSDNTSSGPSTLINVSSLDVLKKLEIMVNEATSPETVSVSNQAAATENTCRRINPLLSYQYDNKVRNNEIDVMVRDKAAALQHLLKKLFDEQQKVPLDKVLSEGFKMDSPFKIVSVTHGPIEEAKPIDTSKPGLTFSGTKTEAEKEFDELEKIIQSYEKKSGKIDSDAEKQALSSSSSSKKTTFVNQQSIRNKKKEKETESRKQQQPQSRIIQDNTKENPDLDLIFGRTATGQSLSFYFSLKWLRKFPELLGQLLPSDSFDVQNFYNRIIDKTTKENLMQDYNLTENVFNDYNVLKCPSVDLTDRFLFLRSSLDS